MTKEEIYDDILYIDMREPVDKILVFNKLKIPVKRINLEKLGLGDYYYQHKNGAVNVERKSQPDFDGSMQNGHLWDQQQKMVNWMIEGENNNQPRYAYFIFIGDTDVYNPHAQVNIAGRIGAIGSLTARGVPVLPASSEDGFNRLLYKLIRSLRENKFDKPRVVDLFKYKNSDAGSLELKEKILRLIPGIGLERAKLIKDVIDLIIKVKPISDEFEDSYEALTSIDGIGDKTAQNIIRLLEDKEEEQNV